MKLRYSPTSPYVRKVIVAAHELGLDSRIELQPTNAWDPKTDLIHTNPLGKVPALTADDGTVLFDSPVICEYLDSVAGGGKLIPAAGPARWTALRRQALGDGMLDAAILRLLESRRPAELQSADWTARQKSVMGRGLDALEAEAPKLGAEITIGHVAIACTLGYFDFRFGADAWRDGRPSLAKWYEGFARRPSMTTTVPKDPK